MASRTLYDPPATSFDWDSDVVHVKPCITVHLLDHDPVLHQQACDISREKAWTTAVHMLDIVLARAAAHTEAVIFNTPPFNESASVLSLMLSSSSSSLSSLSLRLPPLNIARREYSMDLTCSSVRTLVELDAAAALYDKLEHSLKSYTAHVLQQLAIACDADIVGELTFMRLAHVWGHYRLAIAELQEVWVFFDRWYISKTRVVRSIEGLAVAIMKVTLLQHLWLLPRAQVGYFVFLRRDLQHEGDARRELLLFTNLCVAIEVYFLRVEPEILTVVSQFFREEADRMWRSGVGAEVFFQQVYNYLQEGRQRVHACLNENTLLKLEEATQTSLLVEHSMNIFTRDFARLIEEKKYDSVRRAWFFLSSGSQVKPGKQCGVLFRNYILSEGVSIMQRLASKPSHGEEGFAVVKSMISLLCRGEYVIQQCFAEDSMFFTVQLNDAFAEVMQGYQTEFAHQMAFYVDWLLREGKEGVLTSTSDKWNVGSFCTDVTTVNGGAKEHNIADSSFTSPSVQSSTLLPPPLPPPPPPSSFAAAAGGGAAGSFLPSSKGDVFKYIWRFYTLFPSKEIFDAFYWRDLSRRLLHPHRAPNIDIEGSFIEGLKKTCGAETSKFEGMLNDFKASRGLNERYRTWAADRRDNASGPCPLLTHMDKENEEKGSHQQQQQQQCGEREDGTKKKRKREAGAEEGATTTTTDAVVLAALNSNTEVELHILTTAFWPKQASLTISLPAPLHTLAGCVQEFYRHCFTDRRLVWQHQISTAVVKCLLGGVRRQLTGTLLQIAMLLTLQDMMDDVSPSMMASAKGDVTVGALCERLRVDMSLPAVAGALLGMCYSKFHLLLLEPETSGSVHHDGNEYGSYGDLGGTKTATSNTPLPPPSVTSSTLMVTASDRVRFNPHFGVSATRCRIPFYGAKLHGDVAVVDKNGGEGMQTEADVTKEHLHVIEAAIVRFMKETRRANHEELVSAIPSLVHFPVTGPAIKHVIERLINRGFLERNGPTSYTYMF